MTNANDFAHPVPYQNFDGTFNHSLNPGLTKREHFAGLALQGLCHEGAWNDHIQRQAEQAGGDISKAIAVYAVDLADALIESLNKSE